MKLVWCKATVQALDSRYKLDTWQRWQHCAPNLDRDWFTDGGGGGGAF